MFLAGYDAASQFEWRLMRPQRQSCQRHLLLRSLSLSSCLRPSAVFWGGFEVGFVSQAALTPRRHTAYGGNLAVPYIAPMTSNGANLGC